MNYDKRQRSKVLARFGEEIYSTHLGSKREEVEGHSSVLVHEQRIYSRSKFQYIAGTNRKQMFS